MILTTLYDRGNKVFVLYKNCVVEVTIASIIVTLDPVSGEKNVRYILTPDRNYTTFLTNSKGKPKKFWEYQLHPTKNQLIKNL